MLRCFSIYFTITGVKKIFVILRTSLFRGLLYQGSTVIKDSSPSPGALLIERPADIEEGEVFLRINLYNCTGFE